MCIVENSNQTFGLLLNAILKVRKESAFELGRRIQLYLDEGHYKKVRCQCYQSNTIGQHVMAYFFTKPR